MADQMSDARIQIHFDVHQPIELVEMTLSLQSLAYEYQAFLTDRARQEGGKADPNGVKLYITKIESNCILAELAGAAAVLGQLFAVMDYTNIFIDFVGNIKSHFSYYAMLGKQRVIVPQDVEYNNKQIDRFIQLSTLVANNKEGRLGISVLKYEEKTSEKTSLFEVSFTSEEAYEAQQGALRAKSALLEREQADYENVLMYFYQTNTDDPKSGGKTGDKAIIKRVTEKPLPVFILSEIDKQKIRNILDNADVNPLRLGFMVDVNVESDLKEVPKAYRVLRVGDIIESAD